MSLWSCNTLAYLPVWLSISFLQIGENIRARASTYTYTYTGVCDKDWIDYLSIFAVNMNNKAFVARIESIILSIFRVKTIDYRFRFLESIRST